MTETRPWRTSPEWLDEARQGRRWFDPKTALAYVGEEEYLGKLRDVSPGGLGLALKGVRVRRGERLRVAVVFGDRVLEFEGDVVHARATTWGSLAGLSWAGLSESSKTYLSRRYGAPFSPAAAHGGASAAAPGGGGAAAAHGGASAAAPRRGGAAAA